MKMKNQKKLKSQTAEELATYLFDESFKVDLESNVYPTPADELKGEVLFKVNSLFIFLFIFVYF